jgi:hypothetical protein
MFFGISSLGILFINVGCVEHAKIKMNAAYQCLDKINNKRLISLDRYYLSRVLYSTRYVYLLS